MNNFKTKKIDSQTMAIIDLWSYKIRVAICEYRKKDKEKQIKLLSFAEKRQSVWDINQNQINDLENVCENIKIAIEKAEKKANIKVNDFIINSTFSNSFLESSKINYKREKKSQIDINELKKILKEVEKKSILSHIKKIEKKYLYSKQDLNLILNNFSNITINKEKTSSLLGLNWEQISFFITNVFISKSGNETLKYISKFINKNLIEIIPEEFSLTKLWEKNKNIVILNMWNTSSYIIIKDEDSNIIWSIKLEVWIEKLIEQIKENTWLTRSEIIKKIDRDDFAKSEKKDFLEIYSFLIIQALKEILNNKICPNNFFIIGWWW
jgi:cell division ATPase FtsA